MAATQEKPRDTVEEQHVASGDGQPRPQQRTETEQQHGQPGPQPVEQEKSREEEEAAARTAQRKTRLKKIAPIVVVILAVGALLWWLHARQYEDTDDAQVDRKSVV